MTLHTSTRVAFVVPAGQWMGGVIYLRNLFAALRSLPGTPITPIVFVGATQLTAAADFPGTGIVSTPLLDRKSPAWIARKVVLKLTAQDLLLRRLLEQQHIAVLSHSPHLGRQAVLPTIGWIPDFQHVHLPEFFTPEELLRRDRDFTSVCALCTKVVVSSESARADLRAFAPQHAHKAELLQFVASPAPLNRAASLESLETLYTFTGPYFLLPNQFWAHKNHRVVLRALQILKQQGTPLLVLTTGSTNDTRNPAFFDQLMQFAAECAVLDCFRVLGQVPFDHLLGLMHHATAFINPSLFEGWSTSVEEAKSMGKAIVLSDLPVHREQAPNHALFFPPDDPAALAAALSTVARHFDPERDRAQQAEARARFPERQQLYGETYRDIVARALIPSPHG